CGASRSRRAAARDERRPLVGSGSGRTVAPLVGSGPAFPPPRKAYWIRNPVDWCNRLKLRPRFIHLLATYLEVGARPIDPPRLGSALRPFLKPICPNNSCPRPSTFPQEGAQKEAQPQVTRLPGGP